jgi:glutaredoxin-related protein
MFILQILCETCEDSQEYIWNTNNCIQEWNSMSSEKNLSGFIHLKMANFPRKMMYTLASH